MTRLLLLLACSAALAGCAQILGLENTDFDQKDATVDAPSSCDGAPRCTATTERSACGQLFDTGANGGKPLRVGSPTGMLCSDLGSSEGPCALSIQGQPKASFFSANGADVIAGEIDDCGRFVIPDLPATAADIAVVAKGGTDFVDSAVLLIGRPTMVGTDTGLVLPVVSTATETAWGMQLASANPPDLVGSYLVTYLKMNGLLVVGEEIRVSGGAVGKPPALPWGAYFSGANPFGTFDPAQISTQDSGTAAVHPATGTFMLGGFRMGGTCTQVSLQYMPAAIVHVTVRC